MKKRTIPPPPHDPRERCFIETIGDWQVRVFSASSQLHRFFSRHGMLHVQLWHPEAGISVLTPSPITCGQYEVFPVAGWKYAQSDYARLVVDIQGSCGVTLPPQTVVEEVTYILTGRAAELLESPALASR